MVNPPLTVIFVYPCYTFVIPLPKGYATFDYFQKCILLRIPAFYLHVSKKCTNFAVAIR